MESAKPGFVLLTPYEWEERLKYVLENARHQYWQTTVTQLTHLWRHVDGGVFDASPENDKRQDWLSAVCNGHGFPTEYMRMLVKEQREREGVVV